MADETYYSVLEIPETASATEIRSAYRRLISEVHPDRLANAPVYWQRKAEEKTKEINEAFGVLSSPEKRRLYDVHLQTCRASQPSPPPPKKPGAQQSRESDRDQRNSGPSYRSTTHSSQGNPQRQGNSDSATSSTGSTQSPWPRHAAGMTPGSVLLFSMILALFGYSSAVVFWESNSASDGIPFFLVSGALLFGIALLNQGWLSRFLTRTRVCAPRYQLIAIMSVISILLIGGKLAYLPQQSRSPYDISLPSTNASAPSPSPTPVKSNASSDQSFSPVSLPNGTELLKRRRAGGYGKLTVENGTTDDAVIALVDISTKKAIRAFYVEAGKKFTEQQIAPGRYNIFYTRGLGWDTSSRQFTKGGETGVFDHIAAFTEHRDGETGTINFHEISVTLNPIIGGNASTSQLGADDFKSALVSGDLQ